MSEMTPQHPAAPETETDANGLTEAEQAVIAPWFVGDLDAGWPGDDSELIAAVERIVAERVRVVEGERDAAREALDDYLSDPPPPIGNDVIADAQETTAHALEANRMNLRVIERLTEQLAEANESAESAEAAHEGEKAAHERLRTGVRAELFSENASAVMHGVTGTHPESYSGVTKDEALECATDLIERLRSLLGGGEAR